MLAKGIYFAANKSGWSLLELADRLGVDPVDLEEGAIGVAHLEQITALTGYSLGNMRRIGIGLDPIEGNY